MIEKFCEKHNVLSSSKSIGNGKSKRTKYKSDLKHKRESNDMDLGEEMLNQVTLSFYIRIVFFRISLNI